MERRTRSGIACRKIKVSGPPKKTARPGNPCRAWPRFGRWRPALTSEETSSLRGRRPSSLKAPSSRANQMGQTSLEVRRRLHAVTGVLAALARILCLRVEHPCSRADVSPNWRPFNPKRRARSMRVHAQSVGTVPGIARGLKQGLVFRIGACFTESPGLAWWDLSSRASPARGRPAIPSRTENGGVPFVSHREIGAPETR